MDSARRWQVENGLTYPVLSDSLSEVMFQYWYFAPWDAIISTDYVLALSSNSMISFPPQLNMEEILPVFNALFDPQAGLSTDVLDFGQVLPGSSAQLELTVHNTGTGVLDLTSITTSNPAFTVDVTQDSIFAVDDSLVLTVTFTPTAEEEYAETLTLTSSAGTWEVDLVASSMGVSPDPALPEGFALSCYPNPFNPDLTVRLSLPRAEDVTAEVYRADGGRLATFFRGQLPAGSHTLRWADETASSGVYLVKVSGREWSTVRKAVLVR
ncbi:MAG: T9SS C-terminal target domain-containing protein [Candidatus Zixiibacteriota bacterium]|nr:MAG: T9SS C-terminal target domain-containing protein [candidate division Zixibacteria bacterium]